MSKDQVVLIIGAGDYLGSALARRFAKEGFHAVGTRRRGDIVSFVKQIEDSGGKATGIHSDARKEEQVVELIDWVENEIGPIGVFVFNIGGNVMFPVLETTSRVYTKVWEMCALAGFLTGREVARRMVERECGTMLFTGATASVRGSKGFSAFAGGKHALRALAQSMAKELMPKNIHVAHVVIDGPIDTEWTRERFPEMVKERPKDGLLQPDDIAETYWAIHSQKRSAWTFEIDVRPWVETW
ncbi:MAG: Glucose 1-dehydrogenase 4 [Deltaproteobacteria bacterium]|jgi:NAD(P)-dependent dehydrogenase (short-subunit alcohol dehydrogenase family)|nr:Glucose 1-dehydrogenase 4 [Deltaproteobacteria bacterium]